MDQNGEYAMDSNRYDVNPAKLEMFAEPSMKCFLKRRFVTGETSERVMKNLLNMADSDEDKDEEKIDKEQLRKMDINDHKTTKRDKKKKKQRKRRAKLLN